MLTSIFDLFKDIFKVRKLIINLSINDFKTKYAGSYLGITWAFIQPLVVTMVYWFVFQIAFQSSSVNGYPYVLWLILGLFPWFFFSEAFINGTNCLIEYSYLVKKIVFKIDILPIIKIISSLFVHIFFIFLIIIIFAVTGYKFNLYNLQVFYYLFCMLILILGLSYITSSIVVFFRDLGQLISVILQVGIWITPIMWQINMLPNNFQFIIKLNPIYYIINGYRDTFINKIWFFERTPLTIYFWIITIGIFCLGIKIFQKLKIHFADIL